MNNYFILNKLFYERGFPREGWKRKSFCFFSLKKQKIVADSPVRRTRHYFYCIMYFVYCILYFVVILYFVCCIMYFVVILYVVCCIMYFVVILYVVYYRLVWCALCIYWGLWEVRNCLDIKKPSVIDGFLCLW